ncbi:hypothetical protein BXP28_07900 [Paenibacillus larvae subsp. larvae]|nr:hypothetical protein BXP28_07900 [Paenibacillus larvae subsp. larvae]
MKIFKKYELTILQLVPLIILSSPITSNFSRSIPIYVSVVLFITALNVYMETLLNKRHTREQKAVWFLATFPFNFCIVLLYMIYLG